MTVHDVLIVGGGPAGLSTALFLRALCDARIAVLERAHYPREKFCAGAVAARGEGLLARIGVRLDVPAVTVRGISLALSAGSLVRRAPYDIGRVVRRTEFDHALAQAVRARGIALIEGASVTGLVRGSHGVRVLTTSGEHRARVVVGCDGVGSVVRRALGLRAPVRRAQALEVDTDVVAGDGPRDLLHVTARDARVAGYTWDFPTRIDGAEKVCRGAYVVRGDTQAPDVTTLLGAHLATLGLDLARYRHKRFAEGGYTRSEPVAVPRVLLAGESAGIDIVTGEGIAQAIAYGDCAARYLAPRLASDTLHFDDWDETVAHDAVGRDLRARSRFVGWMSGRGRQLVDRAIVTVPAVCDVALAHFAGRLPRAMGLMGAAVRAGG